MARSQQLPDYPDEIMSVPMFHHDISSRQQAEDYVIKHSQGDGSYIVRPNTENDPSYVSITTSTSGNKVCNAKVHIEKTHRGIRYYISDKLKFSTFNALLSYYCEHRIHCKQGIDNLRLSRPLRKINSHVQKRDSLNSLGEVHQASSSSSGSDSASTGVKQTYTGSLNESPVKNKMRANSESHAFVGQVASAGMNKHGGSLKNRAVLRTDKNEISKQQNSSLSRSKSYDNPSENVPSLNVLHYANSRSIEQNPKSAMKCRPPAPLPRPEVPTSEDKFYYTSIEANKDFFSETYAFLKDNEICECGLRICDSELALGWAIHRSQDPATLNRIFFQLGDITTWDMPVELVNHLTLEQVKFLILMCREGKQPVPVCLRERIDKEKGRIGRERR